MKTFLSLIITSIFILGCSKKSSPTGITGKWYLTSNSVTEYVNGSVSYNGQKSYNHQGYFQFNTDGSGLDDIIQSAEGMSNVALDVAEIFTYTYSNNQLILTIPLQTVGQEQISPQVLTAETQMSSNGGLTMTIDQSTIQNGSTYRYVQVITCTR